jgi:hypothetical protein
MNIEENSNIKLINKELNVKELKIIDQDERINNLLNYLDLYTSKKLKTNDSVIGKVSNNYSSVKNNTFCLERCALNEKHLNTFKLNNKNINDFLIKKKWSLYQDFHLLLSRFIYLNEEKKKIFFELFKKIQNYIKTNNIEFNDVGECGLFINKHFIQDSIFTNTDSIKKEKQLMGLRLISYLYYYKYELVKINDSPDEIIKNNYFKISSYNRGKPIGRQYTLKTNISHINEEINIWKSIENKNIVIIFRGTLINKKEKKVEDRNVKSDLSIIFGTYGDIHNLNNGNRLQYSIELYIYLSKLYNDYSISFGGYSLGATTTYYINKYICLKNIELQINLSRNKDFNTVATEIKKPYIIYNFNQARLFVLSNHFKYLKIPELNKISLNEINNNIILILTTGFDPISILNKRNNIKMKKIFIKIPSKDKLKKDIKIFHNIKFLDDTRYCILNLSEDIINFSLNAGKPCNSISKRIVNNDIDIYIKDIFRSDFKPLSLLKFIKKIY